MPRISLQGFFAAATAGWAALETTLAVWFFVIPHGSNFALEIGPAASFAVFSWVYTIGYLALFILLVLPMTILLTKVESTIAKRLLPLASGAVFGLVWGAYVWLTNSTRNAYSEAILFSVAGVACMTVMQITAK